MTTKKNWNKTKYIVRFGIVGVCAGLIGLSIFIVVKRPPSFLRIQDVVVMTPLKRLTEFDLIRLSEVKKGDNILTMSLSDVRNNLLRYPWIKDVRISRRIPARLFVWVEEQEPAALLELPNEASESGWYLVNRHADVFKKVEKGDPKDYPILTGLAPEEIKAGLPQMLELITTISDRGLMSSLGVSEVHWNSRQGLAVFTKDPCIKLELGGLDKMQSTEVWAERLRRFSDAWDTISTTARNPKVVDLSMDRRVFVKQGF